MTDLFLLSLAQISKVETLFPLSHGVPRVDDRRVFSGIIYVLQNGLQWKDVSKGYGPYKVLYNRLRRWTAASQVPDSWSLDSHSKCRTCCMGRCYGNTLQTD